MSLFRFLQGGQEHGADAALEKAKATKDAARKAAEEDRARNLGERGEDANDAETLIREIRRKGSDEG